MPVINGWLIPECRSITVIEECRRQGAIYGHCFAVCHRLDKNGKLMLPLGFPEPLTICVEGPGFVLPLDAPFGLACARERFPDVQELPRKYLCLPMELNRICPAAR